MTRLRRPPSSAWLKRGPLIVKVLFIICVVQIIFTVYVAVRVLKSSLEPDGFVFGGLPSALSERQRDLAEVLGSLDRLDFQQPVEFIPDDIESNDKPTVRRFIMRPLSILDVARHDQELNQLIVSDNKIKSEASSSNVSLDRGPSKSLSSKFPLLKMYRIRPIETSDYDASSPKNDVLVKEASHSSSSGVVNPKVIKHKKGVTMSPTKKMKNSNAGSDKHEISVLSSKPSYQTSKRVTNGSPKNKTVQRIENNNHFASSAVVNTSHPSNSNVNSRKDFQALKSSSSGMSQKSELTSAIILRNIDSKNNYEPQGKSSEKLSNKHPNLLAFHVPSTNNSPSPVSDQKRAAKEKGLRGNQDHQISSTSQFLSSARSTFKKPTLNEDLHPFAKMYSQVDSSNALKMSPKEHNDKNLAQEVLIFSIARALGRYLWTRVIGGDLKEDSTVPGALVGSKAVDGVSFVFREDLTSKTQPSPSLAHQYLVLVASGESETSVSATRAWLDHLDAASAKPLLVLTGSQECNNSWLDPYVEAGTVQGVLITHHRPDADSQRYHQWPLSAAWLASQHPSTSPAPRPARAKRRYLCSLWAPQHGTPAGVSQLVTLLRPHLKRGACSLAYEQENKASNISLARYVESLRSADLVLCPVLSSAETSSIYDAIEAGSVPVVVVGAGSCDTMALRLLKEMGAPFIWLDSWFGLQKVLDLEKMLSSEAKAERYETLRVWYERFQRTMSRYLLEVVRDVLF